MSSVSRWRDSGHLERAVETAGGQEAFDVAVSAMLDEARGWRLAEVRKRRGMTQEQSRRADGRFDSRQHRAPSACSMAVATTVRISVTGLMTRLACGWRRSGDDAILVQGARGLGDWARPEAVRRLRVVAFGSAERSSPPSTAAALAVVTCGNGGWVISGIKGSRLAIKCV